MMLQEAVTISGAIIRQKNIQSATSRNKELSGQLALYGVILSGITRTVSIQSKLE